MSGYLYYCPKCNSLISDTYDDDLITCEKCLGAMAPLHIDEDEWLEMSDDDKRQTLIKYRTPQVQQRKPVAASQNRESAPMDNMNSRQVLSEENYENNRNSYQQKRTSVNTNQAQSEPGRFSKLSIIGFIMSFLGCISFVGVILGIVDLTKKDGRRKGLSIAAIIVGSIMLIASISMVSSNSNKESTSAATSSNTTDKVEESQPVETVTVEEKEQGDAPSEVEESKSDDLQENKTIEVAEPEPEPEVPAISKEEFIASCTDLRENYKSVARDPSAYTNQNFYFTCIISSARESSGFLSGGQKYFISYDFDMDKAQEYVKDGWADDLDDAKFLGMNYDMCVWLFDNRNSSDPDYVKILEDDIVKVYGTFTGMTETKNSLSGEKGEELALDIKYVEIISE